MNSRKWLAIVALVFATLAVGLDITVLNLALPTLAVSLHASTSDLQWFIDAYTLVLGAVLLPAGLIGDRFGRKRVLMLALGLFGIGSLACAYASSPGILIAARALLGVGAAFIIPMSLAVVPVMFTDEERPKAIAVLMIAGMLAFPIGPILGGWLLTNYWWGSVFLINVPVVAVGLIAVALLLPESRGTQTRRIDVAGVLISSAGMALLSYGAIEAGQQGFGDASAIASLALGAVALVLFVFWERRVPEPLVELGLFRSAGFTWGTILATIVSFAMFGVLFAVPQYFQEIRGVNALGSGLRLLPMIGGLIVGAGIATRLAERAGAKVAVALGYAFLAGGLVMASSTRVDSGFGFAATWLVVSGIGLGFAMPTAMDAAIGALTAERSGSGTALIQAVRQVGATLGVAILGSVVDSGYRTGIAVRELPVAGVVRESVAAGIAVARRLRSEPLLITVEHAFVHSMDAMLVLCGGIAAAGVLLALLFLPRRTQAVRSDISP